MTMTAAPDWDIVGPSSTDAELAVASAAGDRNAFAAIYDRYADRLHDFCTGVLRDRDGAADCVQDVFCIAATRMTQLRDPDKLRPWLYSIARSEALRKIRDRDRETVSDELPDMVSNDPSPETLAARVELADLISDAAGGLSDRDRSVLELAYRHGLEGADLAQALGVTQVNANTMVHRLRETIERSLGALLVSRGVRTEPERCAELAAILDGWDGTFTVLMRKRVARHIEKCDICDEERRRLVNPVALLGAAPVFIPAPAWLRERTLSEVELTSSARPLATDHDGATRHVRSSKLPAGLFVAALIAALGLTAVWLQQHTTTAVTPVQVSHPAPAPVAPVESGPPPPPQSAIKAPPPSAPVAPPQQTTVIQPPAVKQPPRALPPAPPPVVDRPAPPPPEADEPAPPPSPPPVPPVPPVPPLPPLPPLQWPPDWQLPQWPTPPTPPSGGNLTGPSNLVIDPPPAVPPL